MDVWTTDDPQAFLDRTAGYLAAEPLLTNVIGVVADRMARGLDRGDDPWFAAVEQDGRVVLAGMQTAPKAYVGPGPHGAAAAFADAMRAAGRTPAGVVGDRATADEAARRWLATAPRTDTGTGTGTSTGTTGPLGVTTGMDEGVYVLAELRPPQGVPGTCRAAGEDDVDLVARWYVDFCTEAFAPTPPPPLDTVVRRVRDALPERRWLLWETDDGPVCLAGRSGPVHGTGRVGPVWTPPALRRNGFAGALTAAVSEALLADGAQRVMLFTDLSNATSNALYRRLGFEQVGGAVDLTFTT